MVLIYTFFSNPMNCYLVLWWFQVHIITYIYLNIIYLMYKLYTFFFIYLFILKRWCGKIINYLCVYFLIIFFCIRNRYTCCLRYTNVQHSKFYIHKFTIIHFVVISKIRLNIWFKFLFSKKEIYFCIFRFYIIQKPEGRYGLLNITDTYFR